MRGSSNKKEVFVELDEQMLKKLQNKGLEILTYFKKFCKENGLTFYLCGGCCIGAARNGRFIPWDDDVDVFMPRRDYEKLYGLWLKNADNEKFSCVKTTSNQFSGNIFTTIVHNGTTLVKPYQRNLRVPLGVAMDVFPLDGCPNGKFQRKVQMMWALIYSLYCAQVVPQNHGKFVKVLGQLMLGLVPSKRFRYKIWRFAEKQMSKYPIKECSKVTELCAGVHYMKNEYPAFLFKEAEYMLFEEDLMPLPTGYHEYLKIAFGDYMTLPPEGQRKPHHDIVFLDLDKSYKSYYNNFDEL